MKVLELADIAALGYDVEEVLPRVFKIKNFIESSALQELINEATSYDEEAWNFRYLEEMRKNAREKFGRDDIENLRAEGLLEVTDTWADKNVSVANKYLENELQTKAQKIFDAVGGLDVTGFIVFQRMYDGSELKAHFDQYSDKLVEYAAVLYLNDDYTEGELFFPNFERTVRPAAGDLLIFPGTEEYTHGVHPVGPGPIRYVIPAFIKSSHPGGSMAGWADFG